MPQGLILELVGQNRSMSCLATSMKTQPQLFCLVILGLTVGVLHGQQSVQPYHVRGTVINARTGNPIAGALVTVQDQELRAAVTDSEGRFEFEGLHGEPVQIRVAKSGFLQPGEISPATSMEQVAIEVNSQTDSVVLKLSPTSAIHGRITSQEGDRLEGVPLILFHLAPVGGENQLLRP